MTIRIYRDVLKALKVGDTVTKGGRSCSSTVPTPQKLCAPTRTN